MPRYVLRFISGKYKGGEFPIEDGKEVIIGRSSDIDVVLVEDMVSRRHAKLLQTGDKITLEDLKSTNGSFVNGEKIQKAPLRANDRILIGTSIMKLVEVDDESPQTRPTMKGVERPEDLDSVKMNANRTLSGVIDEVPLPDLVQLFTSSRKTGTLHIKSGRYLGKVYLEEGKIVYASIDDDPGIPPDVAFYRLLKWEKGDFELLALEGIEFPSKLDKPAEHLLMEGLRQLDEFRHIAPDLPARKTKLVLASPLVPKLADLKKDDLSILQLVHNLEQVDAILTKSPKSDLDTANILLKLLKAKYLQVV